MLYSGILPVLTTSSELVECNIGQEVTVFGLVFVNSTASLKTVTMSIYRQAAGLANAMTFEVGAKSKYVFEKPLSLQPGDHLDVVADATGVNLLWSIDQDAGAAPVLTGFTIRGEYSNVTPYDALDVVFKAGATYTAIQNSTNKDPETETAYWMLLLDGSGTSAAIDAIVAGAPLDLDTLNKIAAAIGDDPDFATTMTDALNLKANTSALAGVAFTGALEDVIGINKLAIRRLFFSRELV